MTGVRFLREVTDSRQGAHITGDFPSHWDHSPEGRGFPSPSCFRPPPLNDTSSLGSLRDSSFLLTGGPLGFFQPNPLRLAALSHSSWQLQGG